VRGRGGVVGGDQMAAPVSALDGGAMSARDAVVFALTGHQLALLQTLPRILEAFSELRTASRLEARGLIQFDGPDHVLTVAGRLVLTLMSELHIEAPPPVVDVMHWKAGTR